MTTGDGEVRIDFEHLGRKGVVLVEHGRVEDPEAAGFDVLAALPFAPDRAVGHPWVAARTEYSGTGFRSLLGWVQVVRTVHAGGRAGPYEGAVRTVVDVPPVLDGLGQPFAALGAAPGWFDAAVCDLDGFARLTWTADTFLTSVPLCSRVEVIRPLACFRWGFADAGAGPVVAPVEVTDTDAWVEHLSMLRAAYPGWLFSV